MREATMTSDLPVFVADYGEWVIATVVLVGVVLELAFGHE
jgi:hypothetical protein